MKKGVGTMNRMGLIGLIIVALLAILVTPVMAQSQGPSLTLNPPNGIVGDTVTVTGTGFTPNTKVIIYFDVSGDLVKLTETSTNSTGGFETTFKVPNVPPGSYNVTAIDMKNKNNTTPFTVIPLPDKKTLSDLGIEDFVISKDVLRIGDELDMLVIINNTTNMNVTIAIIHETNWSRINWNEPTKNGTILNYAAWNNMTIRDISNRIVNWTINATILGNTIGMYYIVIYNTTNIEDYIDMYVVAGEFRVEPNVVSFLQTNNVTVTVTPGGVSYSENVTLNIILDPNNISSINIAIVKRDDWNRLYSNINETTENDIFNIAKWYEEDIQNNRTFQIKTDEYNLTPGVYVVVVFNTTQSGYIHWHNNSTTFDVYPLPNKVSKDELVGIFNVDKHEIRIRESFNITISGLKTERVIVAIINESAWYNINRSLEGGLSSDTIIGNASRNYTISAPGSVITVSDLLPDIYYILIYNVTNVNNTDYIDKYYVYEKTIRVIREPRYVNLKDLNITKFEVDKEVKYGESLNLTINVTGTVKIVIINESAWNELKERGAIRNDTLVQQSKWNMTVSDNRTISISTLGYELLPDKYVVVVYNTTSIRGVEYVDCYNDDKTFTVTVVTEEVSLDELGISSLKIEPKVVPRNDSIRIEVDLKEGVTVNIVIINETMWKELLNTSPINGTVWNNSVWNRTLASDLIETIQVNYLPDKYVVVVYKVENEVITKYNDRITFEVIVESRNVNLTDLVNDANVSVIDNEAKLKIDYNATPINVAILSKDVWEELRDDRTILNETIIEKSKWNKTNVTTDLIEDINISGWEAGEYVVVIYNTTTVGNEEYVNCYNDSLTFEKVKPANVTVINFTVKPEIGVAPLEVKINVTVVNTGDIEGNITVRLYINGEEVDNKTVTVGGNETKYVTFNYTFEKPGTYNVSVNNLTPKIVRVEAKSEYTITVPIKEGWNMISVPLKAPITCDIKFEYIYAWDAVNKTYVPVTTFEPGKGYWVLSDKEINVTFTGSEELSEYEINLIEGWNLIGTIAYKVDVSKLPMDKIVAIYTWDAEEGRYVVPETLEPGKAYWILAKENITLKLPPS